MNGGKQFEAVGKFRLVLGDAERGGGDIVLLIEFFLVDLVLNDPKHCGFGDHANTFLLELFQCLHVYLLDLDGEYLYLSTKLEHGLVVADISQVKVVAEGGSRTVWVILHHVRFGRIVGCCLQQHASQLPAAQDTNFGHAAKIAL